MSAPFNDECECAEVIQLRTQIEESRRLMTLALDFWAAPGIDMPDIDTFNDMVVFLEETGEPWVPKGEPYKPVGMTVAEHDRREDLTRAIRERDGEALFRIAQGVTRAETMSPCLTCNKPVVGYEECPHCGGCSCPECGEPHQVVRPGKTQPTCTCQDE